MEMGAAHERMPSEIAGPGAEKRSDRIDGIVGSYDLYCT